MAHSANNTAYLLEQLMGASHLPTLANVALRIAVVLTLWTQRRRSRQALANLTDAQLNDIGISRTQAREEAKRPFWV
jgi:uncharacterized protein YjiS (DUF1127 family)